MLSDPIADMLNRIKNAQAVKRPTASFGFSKIKLELAKILEKEELISGIIEHGRKANKIIEIALKYDENNAPVMSSIKRISCPGQRIYKKRKEIKPVRENYSLVIISTSSGLMTNREAIKKGLGGEIICEIYK